ncbi:dihydrofolate reductase [Kitasatospora sp. NPDC001664]
MSVGLIWAQTVDGVIGRDNAMPWHLPEDLAHFKATTLGRPVVMGRRTWDALPPRFRPLPGRRNIVVTRDPQWRAEGAERAGSVPEALASAAETPSSASAASADSSPSPADIGTWVIGGGELYRATLALATVLSVTEIDLRVQGDTHAPELDPAWSVVADEGWRTSVTGLRYRVLRYTRSPGA